MKEVRKKSADTAVNEMLVKAYRQKVDLAWDRAEAMQPQCGFGRMAICCSDCFEGPCRVNPFATSEQQTICGRNQAALIVSNFMNKAVDGAASLVKLAVDFGGEVGNGMYQSVLASQDGMIGNEYGKSLAALGESAIAALEAIGAAKAKVYGQAQPDVAGVNFGVLRADSANVVLHGHVAPQAVQAIVQAAAKSAPPVNISSICGSEISASLNIPTITNYDSQELPLLTGAVDVLVLGNQCVMPSVLALAAKKGITVVAAAEAKDAIGADKVVAAAVNGFKRRGNKADIPAVQEDVYAGYDSKAYLAALGKAYAQGSVKGLVYFGGCGNIAHTQDADIVKMAATLVEEGYALVTSGCAGTALAKAGMCKPDYAGAEALNKALPEGTPAALNLGSCHDASQFVAMAKALAASKVPVMAVMPEITHNKTLATAIGFAAKGIPTFVGLDEICLPDNMGGCLMPLTEFRQLPQAMAEVAAAK